MDLNLLWFVLLGVLLAGYAILDGFDLGVGILHRRAKGDHQRRHLAQLDRADLGRQRGVAGHLRRCALRGLSGSVRHRVLGLLRGLHGLAPALILRAVSIEFRSKVKSTRWRAVWDHGFWAGSLLASFLFGVAVGAAMKGVPLNERGIFAGRFLDQLSPYALVVGVMAVAIFTDAWRNLPVPQDRGRPPGAGVALGVERVLASSW